MKKRKLKILKNAKSVMDVFPVQRLIACFMQMEIPNRALWKDVFIATIF